MQCVGYLSRMVPNQPGLRLARCKGEVAGQPPVPAGGRTVARTLQVVVRGESPLMAVTYRVPGAVLTERAHSVPLDHAKPDGETITLFTRELAAPDGLDRPYLLFLQGGPGIEATRPTAPPSGWQKRALADYRVLLIDQRGTGRSTPVGDMPGSTPQEQAAYLTH